MRTLMVAVPRGRKLLVCLFFSLVLGLVMAGSDNSTPIDCTDIPWSSINTSNTARLSQIFQQCLDGNGDCYDPLLCSHDSSSATEPKILALAFGLTIGAGLATTLGALIPFLPFVRRKNTTILSICLALAGGVMLFVSFTEILRKSRDYLCCVTELHADLVSYSCFFFGILITCLLDLLVVFLGRIDCGWPYCGGANKSNNNNNNNATVTCCGPCRGLLSRRGRRRESQTSCNHGDVPLEDTGGSSSAHANGGPHYHGGGGGGGGGGSIVTDVEQHGQSNSDSPTLLAHTDVSIPDNDVMQTERISISAASNTVSTTTNNLGDASIQDLLSNTSIHRMHTVAESASANMEAVSISINNENYDGFSLNPSLRTQSLPNGDIHSRVSAPSLQRRTSYEEMVEQQEIQGIDGMEQFREVTDQLTDVHKLKRMGLLTGLAIALHNFPEGLATFVATLSDPSFGGALAIAIALHNIPEGICVAMPVYYATGSKLKAFFWSFLSGISEPLGALLGWAILQRIFGPPVYGIAFGIIAGMMVYISLKEIIPTAHKFDKTNGIMVAIFLVVGMIVMALSLVLLTY